MRFWPKKKKKEHTPKEQFLDHTLEYRTAALYDAVILLERTFQRQQGEIEAMRDLFNNRPIHIDATKRSYERENLVVGCNQENPYELKPLEYDTSNLNRPGLGDK